jgi:hypothetical protein
MKNIPFHKSVNNKDSFNKRKHQPSRDVKQVPSNSKSKALSLHTIICLLIYGLSNYAAGS